MIEPLQKTCDNGERAAAQARSVPAERTLPVTVLIAARNEEANIRKCLASLHQARRVVLIDSHSKDQTAEIAQELGAEVIQFTPKGCYPKKRQWGLDTLPIDTEWILLLDADEIIPPALWQEIATVLSQPQAADAYIITKGFHFLGRRFRFGGFSFGAVLLFRRGRTRFEKLHDEPFTGLDMEIHERLIVSGTIGKLRTPLIHEDFKGLEAYLDRHNRYSTWEAKLRYHFIKTRQWGTDTIRARLFGNTQERRRWLKFLAVRVPGEPFFWFLYHYVFRLGFLEGRPGLIACRIRSQYISQVRAKLYELKCQEQRLRIPE